MCSADSLLQRLGRCYRKRTYFGKEPNIYIYNTENGLGYVYDEVIFNRSARFIESYNGKLFSEADKAAYIDKVYDPEDPEIKSSDYYKEIEKKIGEITGLIEEVENSQISTASTKTGVFSIEDLPNFDVDTCIKTIISKCTSYYSEFSSDVDESLSSNSVLEKADYITREYLQTKVDKLFYDYVSEIANSVNNDLDLDINEEFISSNLDKIMSELRKQLKRLFVYPYRDKEADSSDVYINVIAASLENQITFYEQLVNSTIENKLALFGYVLRGQEEAPIQTR